MLFDQRGSVLIQFVIVIFVVVLLVVLLLPQLDSKKRLGEGRDIRRQYELDSILTSVKLYQVDSGGSLPKHIAEMNPNKYYQIGNEQDGCNVCEAVETEDECANLSELVQGGYLREIPRDPLFGTQERTGYFIFKGSNNVMQAGACSPEQMPMIRIFH